MSRFFILAFTVIVLCTIQVQAEVVTIDATIESVDAKTRTITVKRKDKTKELDVSRKVKITIKGEKSSLDDLKVGQNVSLSYHTDLEIVLKIEIPNKGSSDALPETELVEVAELINEGNVNYPWVSENGLRIYWEDYSQKTPMIWTAKREDTDSFFEEKAKLFKGRHPTLSKDALEMIVLVDGVLHSATRSSEDQKFRRPALIRELKDQPKVKNPAISLDGLKLYFNRFMGNDGPEIVVSTRESRQSKWSKPKLIPMRKSGLDGFMTWGNVSEDGLTLYCTHEGSSRVQNGNLMVWSRSLTKEPFSKYKYIEFPEIAPLLGRSPRYVPATNELYFTKFMGTDAVGKKQWGIWVIKNFDQTEFTK